MSTNKYIIAGLKVLMTAHYDMLEQRSSKYLADFDGEPDFVIEAPEDKMEKLRRESPVLNDAQREYIVTAAHFYNYLLEYDGFLLHSSAISYDGKAYLFSADCGTGKSTHTRLWCEYLGDAVTKINDDKPAVRLIDGVFCAIGTPWSGKTAENENVIVPVGGVVLLERGLVNKIEPAETRRAVMSLLRQTFFPPKRENTDRMADLLDKFIRSVPVYRLECDMSEDAVKTSYEALTGKKYEKGNK